MPSPHGPLVMPSGSLPAWGRLVFGDLSARRDLANTTTIKFREPEVTIGATGNVFRLTLGIGQGIFGDLTARRDRANAVAIHRIELGKPEVAIRPSGDIFAAHSRQ